MTAPAHASRFWDWVVAHALELARIAGKDDPLLDELLASLHEYNSELYFELGGHPGETIELIITAEGNSAAFDAVRLLVDAAPSLPGWQFIAFKPAQGFAFVTEHGRARIDASTSWFMPMTSASHQHSLGLNLACADYTPDAHDDYLFAARIVIHTGLGELAATTAIDHLQVERTPADPAAQGYIELPELAKYLAWRDPRRR